MVTTSTIRSLLVTKAKPIYTLMEKGNTGEFHLFLSHKTEKNPCVPGPRSVCDAMTLSEFKAVKFACKDEDEARLECAKIGKMVCGSCVSHLYLTPKK